MPIKPVTRVAVSESVFSVLATDILNGAIPAGEPLASERALAEGFAVNRHAVREALKRLQQAGLITISQGGKTQVEDWRERAGLDILGLLAKSDVVPPAQLIDDVVEIRATLGSEAAALCAVRGKPAHHDEIVAAVEAIDAEVEDVVLLGVTNLRLWNAIVDGADNLAYRLGLNTLATGFSALGLERVPGLVAEYRDQAGHRLLAQAITQRDAETARRRALDLLSRDATHA